MFLHRGKRHVVMGGELAHGRIGVHYAGENVAPRRIRERAEQLVQNVRRWLLIYNHLVVDNSTTALGVSFAAPYASPLQRFASS